MRSARPPAGKESLCLDSSSSGCGALRVTVCAVSHVSESRPGPPGCFRSGVIALAAPLAARLQAVVLAVAVHLLEQVAHDADEREGQAGDQQNERRGPPEGAVGRQPRLK